MISVVNVFRKRRVELIIQRLKPSSEVSNYLNLYKYGDLLVAFGSFLGFKSTDRNGCMVSYVNNLYKRIVHFESTDRKEFEL